MKVIIMDGVVVRPQNRVEQVARTLMSCVKEPSFVLIVRPVCEHGYAASVRKNETSDIDGVCGLVLASPTCCCTFDVATRIADQMIDAGKATAQMFLGNPIHL